MQLEGIHHVTAITGDARRNVDFYTRVLGLRLVAKSVNQDDPSVYHLFYSDEVGSPGADITFFEYPGAAPGRPGAGMVHRVVSRVGSEASLTFWQERLEALGVDATRESGSLRFSDPEGLDHELVVNGTGDAPLIADHPEIPPEHAIQGFEGVRAYAQSPAQSGLVLEHVMGGRWNGDAGWELRGARRGGWIAYDPAPEQPGRQSGGTVHHVAWYSTDEDHPRWLERLDEVGLPNSGMVDRTYFHSIYFREPSGVLFELADEGPGFTVDGPVEELGTRIILPPQFEPRRDELEARLTPLPDPRADWPQRSSAG